MKSGRPKPGTITGLVWEVADELTAELGRKATRTEVRTVLFKRHPRYAESTFVTQISRWSTVFDKVHPEPDDAAERIANALEALVAILRLQIESREDARKSVVAAASYPWGVRN